MALHLNTFVAMGAFLLVLLFVALPEASAQITFTGNAAFDFDPTRLTATQLKSFLKINKTTTPVGTTRMRQLSRVTGMAIKNLYMQYEYTKDKLYFGVECRGICGDADGDGDPSSSSDPQVVDNANYCSTEQLSIMLWPTPPDTWIPNPSQFNYFFPTIVIGVKQVDCLTQFGAFLFAGRINVLTGNDECPFQLPLTSCLLSQEQLASNPGTSGSPSAPGYGANITQLASQFPDRYKPVPSPALYALPSSAKPHIEFVLGNISNYPGFNFKPGYDDIFFGMSVLSSLAGTSIGASEVYPNKFFVRCPLQDACGVCGGDNSSCADCKGVPNGLSRYDACGVCGGTNSTCKDCFGVPNGPAHYDACGVCGGTNSTCRDCRGVPNGSSKYDFCGVCAGNNSTCLDCKGVPRGTSKYDACGVCGGNNSTCKDCRGVPTGTTKYDACGVCGGTNSTCKDCFGVPNGPSKYDYCGVCAGNNGTCLDCFGIPRGTGKYDLCGICGGDNSACKDCFGIPRGRGKYDACGICGGDNATCTDCKGVVNGPARYHPVFGICDWDGVGGCDGNPWSGLQYDACGICGGDGSACRCEQYLGYDLEDVDYALLQWTTSALLLKINDTLDILYEIQHTLPYYDYKTGELSLAEYIDVINSFCDHCLTDFEHAQNWFAGFLAGHCEGIDCGEIDIDQVREEWDQWHL